MKGACSPTDYSSPHSWSKQVAVIEHPIDLFFVHPTSFGAVTNGGILNASLSNEELNRQTDQSVIDVMTGIFSEHCNVFAPRYQQMSISVLSFPPEKQEPYLEIAKQDVQASFVYYLKHLNNGRPFILASHSQGSYMLKLVLSEQPELIPEGQLVAAYLVGYTITDDDLQKMKLKLSAAPDDLGTIITWNTIAPGADSPVLLPGARCVNPLTWTQSKTTAAKKKHLGARIYLSPNQTLFKPNFTSATISQTGGLEIPPVSAEIEQRIRMPMGPGCYHVYDYDFFYENTKTNVATRCRAFLKTNPNF